MARTQQVLAGWNLHDFRELILSEAEGSSESSDGSARAHPSTSLRMSFERSR
jgi:hypothetical protein